MDHAQPSLRSGEKIPLFDGTNDHLIFDREHLNKLIAVANAILQNTDWVVTDHGIITSPSGGSISPGKIRGEYDSATLYNIGDIVLISTGPNQGTYICIQSSTGNNPWLGGGFWMQLLGGLSNSWM